LGFEEKLPLLSWKCIKSKFIIASFSKRHSTPVILQVDEMSAPISLKEEVQTSVQVKKIATELSFLT
jgi:hypothetical protein